VDRTSSRIDSAEFGLFEVDFAGHQLCKKGLRIKLQDQPFQLLTVLLERPGEIVTRNELRQRLWPADTFVEFDDGLNSAVKKLRAALNDSPENPRFIETVPRQGYRFLAPVTFRPRETASQPAPNSVGEPSADDPLHAVARTRAALPLQKRNPLLLASALVVIFVLVAAVAVAVKLRGRAKTKPMGRATVVLADFANSTGDPIFNDALKQALAIELHQSPILTILSDRKVGATQRLMNMPSGEVLTASKALQVCQRSGSDAVVAGSVSKLGAKYLIGLSATSCSNGDSIGEAQMFAASKEDVVAALGRASSKLREQMGESLASVQKHDVALEQATTPSLEALQAYNTGLKIWDEKGNEASIPFFNRAVELDPSFAMAYAALGTIYHNMNDESLSNSNAQKAYELKSRVTDFERFSIESRYYRYVTGELEKAAQVYEFANQEFPGFPSAHANLGAVHGAMGHHEKATEEFRESLRLDPSRANSYGNLAMAYLALNRSDDARQVLDEAAERKLGGEPILDAEYDFAFLQGDSKRMQSVLTKAAATPETEALLLARQSRTEAFHGRMREAHDYTRRAVVAVLHAEGKDAAAVYLGDAAMFEADTGNFQLARKDVAEAMALSSSREVQTIACVVLASTGELQRSRDIAESLAKKFPADTLIQRYWLPSIHAAIAFKEGRTKSALQSLDSASSYELAYIQSLEVAPIYPAYLRGLYYLADHQPESALAEFQKFVDHRGAVLNFHTAALARLGAARAYAMSGQRAKASVSYVDFLQLWKDADPNIPLLGQARAEFASVRPTAP
jgi:DNA-binding winged helix-turn-helix (wHTH) protein/tetratricopeptide (TPR) repeat protein